MAGTSEITLEELPELYQDLERQHLVPLWENRPTAPTARAPAASHPLSLALG